MTIEFPFELGQKVWPIQNRNESVWIVCEACDGEGVVTLKNGIRHCPECCGRRGRQGCNPTKWMIAEGRGSNGELYYMAPLTVGQIRIYIGGSEEPNRVMTNETGVGSGTLWYASDIFATEEEAEAECASRNAAESEVAA